MASNAQELFRRLRALQLPPRDIVIVGSGPMAACGLLDDLGDLDVLARGPAWVKALTLGPVRVGEKGDLIVSIDGGRLEIFDGWTPEVWPVKTIFETAEWLDGLPFARLEFVLAVKRAALRPKDEPHVALLKRHLKCPNPVCEKGYNDAQEES